MSRARLTERTALGAAAAALLAAGLLLPPPAFADPAPAAGAAAPAPSTSPRPAAPLTVTRPQSGEADASDRREANRAAILDARLAELHVGLQLGAGQESLWPPVAAAIRDVDKLHLRRWHRTMRDADNSVDGLKLQGAHLIQVGTAIGRLADATGPLLTSLTADQKSRLPVLLERLRPRRILARAFGLPEDTPEDRMGDRGMGGGRMGGGRGMDGGRGMGRGYGMGDPDAPGGPGGRGYDDEQGSGGGMRGGGHARDGGLAQHGQDGDEDD